MRFQQIHDDGRGDVVGKIGADRHRHSRKLLLDQLVQIDLEHILVDDLDVVKLCQRLVQHRQQAAVDLDADHLVRAAGKLGGQHPDPRADLDDAPAGLCVAHLGHAGADGGVNQKILSQPLGKRKAVAGKHIPNHRDVGQVFHEMLLSAKKRIALVFEWARFLARYLLLKAALCVDRRKTVHRKVLLWLYET